MKRHGKASSLGLIEGHSGIRGVLVMLVLALLALAIAPVLASADPPPPTVGSATEVSYASAHVTGTVNGGEGVDAYWSFQYSTDGGATWTTPECLFCNYIDAPGPRSVEGNLNLQGGTHYEVRLMVLYDPNNQSLEALSPEPNLDFTTLPVDSPKVLDIEDAEEVSYTTAKASGEVERPANPDSPPFDPNAAFNANCRFEFVTDAAFSEAGFDGAREAGCEPENTIAATGPSPVTASLTELAPGTTYHLRLTVSNAGGSNSQVASTFTTGVVPPPDVSISPPSFVTATLAHFSGKINPQAPVGDPAFEVSWHFECQPACPDLQGGTIGPDNTSHEVTTEASGLQPNTSYEVTLVATNLGGSGATEPLSFKTEAPGPVVQTLGVGDLHADSASLTGRINPLNSPVSYQFEWSKDESYEDDAPAMIEPLGAADNSFHIVTAPLVNLEPATVYHYRIAATNTQNNQHSVGQDRTFTTAPLPGSSVVCPNESSRTGFSAGLPDCRAYEFTTPGFNSAAPAVEWPSFFPQDVRADGGGIAFVIGDSPENSEGNTSITNTSIALRGPGGWATKGLSSPTPVRSGNPFGPSPSTLGFSIDLSQSVLWTPQPLVGSDSPAGTNLYLRRADGSFVALTKVGRSTFTSGGFGEGVFAGASRDFKHLFLAPCNRQLLSDPIDRPAEGTATCEGNTYEWVNGELRLLAILPGPGLTPMPTGGAIPRAAPGGAAISDDGENVLFIEGLVGSERGVGNTGPPQSVGPLFLREEGERTVEVSASQQTEEKDSNSPAPANAVGIAADGSEVLFTSRSELTDDANTGEVEGMVSDQGNDLYSYDVESGKLTDLTVDEKAIDAATGANVERIVGVSRDGSYIYFVASGDLAQGAISGERNLYIEHEGVIRFIAPAGGMFNSQQQVSFYTTPNGHHAAFLSNDSLTGYDSRISISGTPVLQAFKYDYEGSTLTCASCLPTDEGPTADVSLGIRTLSDDGRRLFFQSKDAVVPGASNGLSNVYQYEDGEVHLLTPGDGSGLALLMGASASGNDVFIATHEELASEGQGPVFAIYDARVNANTARPIPSECQGEGCREGTTSPPNVAGAGTINFRAPGKVSVSGFKKVLGDKVQLRVIAPGSGEITVSGKGLKPERKRVSKAGSVTIVVSLNRGAVKALDRKRAYRTRAGILFKPSIGDTSEAAISLEFKASSKKKGGK